MGLHSAWRRCRYCPKRRASLPRPPWRGVRSSSRPAVRRSHARDQLKGAGDDDGQEADGQQNLRDGVEEGGIVTLRKADRESESEDDDGADEVTNIRTG